MLQVDHIYEFFTKTLFKDYAVYSLPNGVYPLNFNKDILPSPHIFNERRTMLKIFFLDQEPILGNYVDLYLKDFVFVNVKIMSNEQQASFHRRSGGLHPKEPVALITSEKSILVNQTAIEYNLKNMYYFFHGFAAQDWYRGYYALNYNKDVFKEYEHDYISFNRIITNDRSYRIYFVSKLVEQGLLDRGQVSFNVTDNQFDDWRDEVADPDTKLSEHARQHAERHLTDIDRLVIDHAELPGSASADMPREIDAFWHIVTETVFYYPKLHLTEKIFKPIVSKQPFMLLAAPGNLKYLQDYGFMTFDSVIDEGYDDIQDNDLRVEAVVEQLRAYCSLSPRDKLDFIRAIEPIIEHNFHHFYGEFRHIITRELLDNTKTLFKDLDYTDNHIYYDDIYHVLTH